MTSRPSTVAPILAVLAIVLVTLGATYAVAYFVSVQRSDLADVSEGIATYYPSYQFGGNARVFEPIHLLDRHWIQPEYWRETIFAS